MPPRLRPRRLTPRRSLIIPAAMAIVAVAIIAGLKVSPHLPYWFAGDPWRHSHLVPDRAPAHLQLNLSRLTPDTRGLIQGIAGSADLPADTLQQLPDFAGRYASLTLMPEGGYAAIIDVRHPEPAQEFVASAADDRLSLSDGRLIFVSDPDLANSITDYQADPNRYSLNQTQLYRHAMLHRPQSDAANAGMFFLRWNALDAMWNEEIGLLTGCDPDEYATGALHVDQGRFRLDASCIALTDAAPPQASFSAPEIPEDAEFFLQAAFITDKARMESLIATTGIPALAQLHLLLDSLPGTPPYADPLDQGATPSALDELLAALDGQVKTTITAGRLSAELDHHDPAAIAAFTAQLDHAGVRTDGLSHDDRRLYYETTLTASPAPPLTHAAAPLDCADEHNNQVVIAAHELPGLPSPGSGRFCYASHHDGDNIKITVAMAFPIQD